MYVYVVVVVVAMGLWLWLNVLALVQEHISYIPAKNRPVAKKVVYSIFNIQVHRVLRTLGHAVPCSTIHTI